MPGLTLESLACKYPLINRLELLIIFPMPPVQATQHWPLQPVLASGWADTHATKAGQLSGTGAWSGGGGRRQGALLLSTGSWPRRTHSGGVSFVVVPLERGIRWRRISSSTSTRSTQRSASEASSMARK
ncbi:uncharacterized protein LOC110179443 [Drosophila serrata]|uniref:uncharacterized protein LOC110179443 n=1 Tax=Drosophila serrata TaxID=7274 RepID=UPI000A1D3770|nr:uncharacterized protein LOC110179443 [Drosophila serrata]